MSKYHINPNTGMPGKCTAAPGNCPYGADSEHFTTYSEAFVISQKNLENSFSFLPGNLNEIDDETETVIASLEQEQEMFEMNMTRIKSNDGDFYGKKNEIQNITDPEILLGIIDWSLEEKRDWSIVGAALRNENLPKNYINDVIYKNFNEHNPGLIKRLLCNPKLTNEDLEYVLNNTSDNDAKLIAYMHPNLSKETVLWHIDNNEAITEYPYNGMLINPTHRQDPVIRKWSLQLLIKGIDPGFPKSRQIYNNYQ